MGISFVRFSRRESHECQGDRALWGLKHRNFVGNDEKIAAAAAENCPDSDLQATQNYNVGIGNIVIIPKRLKSATPTGLFMPK